MFPGVNPRQMKQMMKQMGMQQIDIDASEVIIKTGDSEIHIKNPQVAKVKMMGQETYQISGDEEVHEVKAEINEEDVKTVMEQAGVDEATAKKALDEADGDIAQAIMNLQ